MSQATKVQIRRKKQRRNANLYQVTFMQIILCSITIPLGFTGGYLFKKQFLSNLLTNPNQPIGEPVTIPQSPEQPRHFHHAVNHAMSAATLTQIAKTEVEWTTVVKHWQEAISRLQAVPPNDPNYQISQAKIAEYQRNLAYARKQYK